MHQFIVSLIRSQIHGVRVCLAITCHLHFWQNDHDLLLIIIIIIIIAVISIGPYLTDNGEHITLYNINNNVFIKTSKIINYTVMIFFTRTHARKGRERE